MTPSVWAVVLNWNGLEHTLACLESLEQLSYPHSRLHVVVVDNGSKVSPRAVVEKSYPQVEVIETAKNLGYSGGNNFGIDRALAAGADYVWILNNDTTLDAAALGQLVATAQSHPRAAAVGGKVFLADPADTLWVTWGRVTWMQSLISLVGAGRPDGPAYDGQRQVPWIPGCSIMMRAEALRDLGGFDDEFFAYHEDVEWAARARHKGWELWYTGSARIYHSVHASSGGRTSYQGFRKYLSARNSILYARRHGRPWQWLLMGASILLTLPFQYLRRLATGEQGGVVMKVRGWTDALRGRPIPFEELGLR